MQATYTAAQIREKINCGESFWVAKPHERSAALNHALAIGAKYTSGADDRGGFYVVKVTLPPRPDAAVVKPSGKNQRLKK